MGHRRRLREGGRGARCLAPRALPPPQANTRDQQAWPPPAVRPSVATDGATTREEIPASRMELLYLDQNYLSGIVKGKVPSASSSQPSGPPSPAGQSPSRSRRRIGSSLPRDRTSPCSRRGASSRPASSFPRSTTRSCATTVSGVSKRSSSATPPSAGGPALRWHGRYCREIPDVSLEEAQAVLATLALLPTVRERGASALSDLLYRRGLERRAGRSTGAGPTSKLSIAIARIIILPRSWVVSVWGRSSGHVRPRAPDQKRAAPWAASSGAPLPPLPTSIAAACWRRGARRRRC